MLTWENSGFSVDASVRITFLDRDVPSYFRSLEHLLRYCARPPFALERLSVIRGPAGRITQVCYMLPRQKSRQLGRARPRPKIHAAGSQRRRRAPAAPSSSTGSLISSRRRGSTGIGITGCLPRITS
jgi:hypothetical protein